MNIVGRDYRKKLPKDFPKDFPTDFCGGSAAHGPRATARCCCATIRHDEHHDGRRDEHHTYISVSIQLYIYIFFFFFSFSYIYIK